MLVVAKNFLHMVHKSLSVYLFVKKQRKKMGVQREKEEREVKMVMIRANLSRYGIKLNFKKMITQKNRVGWGWSIYLMR